MSTHDSLCGLSHCFDSTFMYPWTITTSHPIFWPQIIFSLLLLSIWPLWLVWCQNCMWKTCLYFLSWTKWFCFCQAIWWLVSGSIIPKVGHFRFQGRVQLSRKSWGCFLPQTSKMRDPKVSRLYVLFGSVLPKNQPQILTPIQDDKTDNRTTNAKIKNRHRWVPLYSNMDNPNSCLIQSPFFTHLLSLQC